jgi:hypothetical protein
LLSQENKKQKLIKDKQEAEDLSEKDFVRLHDDLNKVYQGIPGNKKDFQIIYKK